MKVDAKIAARQWILNAIQNHSCIPNKETEREIRRLVERLQRDIRQIVRSRELYQLVNSSDPDARAAAEKLIQQDLPRKGRQRRIEVLKRQKELSELIKKQKRDAKDTRMRFEHAISK